MSKRKVPFVSDYVTSLIVRQTHEEAARFPFVDLDDSVRSIIRAVEPYTLTSGDRIAELCTSVDYIIDNDIPGAFVECGVWRGGSLMATLLRLLERGISDRDVAGFDMFTGLGPSGIPTQPTPDDADFKGRSVERMMNPGKLKQELGSRLTHFEVSRDEVFDRLASTGYPPERIHLVAGPVEDTIPEHASETIALLRLDTDLYGSTRHELEHLYPRIPVGGVLVIDDYGHFKGARKAADEYLKGHRILLHRVDSSCRFAVKQQEH
ncbi:hypothetical protein A9W99_04905 [Mycobacterium sp. 1164966.3]|uniref:TylF/MycF/NovP-related O-methyltransferase n=1 Tax=Mycobacterium sp. 1164966.3 TaxID=1856861 RepID=UPI0008019B1A|nr:TylF/MycF/NovP-related O-methyltransferase [Mycobacterium sp. 1164966.3]OBA84269.1 hypothetical protein A9W99_04905 [Mycobacterium sp. 1164966.3]